MDFGSETVNFGPEVSHIAPEMTRKRRVVKK